MSRQKKSSEFDMKMWSELFVTKINHAVVKKH